jgi:sucrose-6-phosphate hydrolase SacC (GH32 family)
MAFSGGGFVDFNNSSGLGKNTLFVAFTSTGRGECLSYSKDGGRTFTELDENPVVKHAGRDPQITWYAPEKKWVMSVYDESPCAETKATAEASGRVDNRHIAFWESTNLRKWTRTGGFTDPDRAAVFECPNLIELPIVGKPKETRWVLYGAENRFFIGKFDGKTFTKEVGPQVGPRGAVYAAQLFSNTPDRRGIQIGWVRTVPSTNRYPDQIVSQGFTLPQELIVKETTDGLRVLLQPVKETEILRRDVIAKNVNEAKACAGEPTEVFIEYAESGKHEVMINGIDATFTGRSVRIDGGLGYFANARSPGDVESTRTAVKTEGVKSFVAYRLKSIWNKDAGSVFAPPSAVAPKP